jgi:alpha-tubulin suppressor-like RCC1 family protein
MRSLAALHSRRIVSVAAGKRHSLAVDEAGVVFAWGDGSSGQLGLGDRAGRTAPTVIRWLTEKNIVVKEVYAGQARSFVRCASGVVYCFGSNNDGALGLELQYDQLLPALLDLNPQSTAATVITTPRTPRDSGWRGVSDGGTPVDVTQVVKPAAVRPTYAQATGTPPALPSTTPPLGLSSSWRESSTASIRRVAEGASEYEVRLLATGHESTIAVTGDGSVFVFGTLGDTRLICPTVVLTEDGAPLGGRLREISAGYRSATLVTEAGEAFVWSLGKGAFDPHTGQVRAPEQIVALSGHRVVSASSGNSNFVAAVEVCVDDGTGTSSESTSPVVDDGDDVVESLFASLSL